MGRRIPIYPNCRAVVTVTHCLSGRTLHRSVRRMPTLVLAAAIFSSHSAAGKDDEPGWPADDFDIDVRAVNEGELRFLDSPPEQPVHHHHNRMEILSTSLADGWVRLNQCHSHLDPVPDTQIVYHPDRVRGLEIVSRSGIGRARVEGHTIQMEEIRRGARICISADTRALSAGGKGRFLLKNGPFMRQFLDGFYPMHVTMEIRIPGPCLALRRVDPKPRPGFTLTEEPGVVYIDAWFEGRLTTAIEFEQIDASDTGADGC